MAEQIFPANTAALPQVMDFLEQCLEQVDCPMNVTMRLCIALEEMFVNICHYAYPDGEGEAKFTVQAQPGGATFRLEDSGTPFDPLARPETDISESAISSRIGGLGIHITKKTMDRMDYCYENGKNILTMYKSWD